MYAAVLALHVLVSAALIMVVLMQSGKGGGLAGAFGGAGGVGAAFGGQTAATFLSKMTRYLAVVFMATSLTLAMLVRTRVPATIADEVRERQAVPAATLGEDVPATTPETGETGLELGPDEGGTPAPPENTQGGGE